MPEVGCFFEDFKIQYFVPLLLSSYKNYKKDLWVRWLRIMSLLRYKQKMLCFWKGTDFPFVQKLMKLFLKYLSNQESLIHACFDSLWLFDKIIPYKNSFPVFLILSNRHVQRLFLSGKTKFWWNKCLDTLFGKFL